MNIICDSSSLISLSSTCILDCLPFLADKTRASFLVPPAVEREISGRASQIEKYWFSALRLKNLLRRNVLRNVSSHELARETEKIMGLANSVYGVRGRNLQIIQEGEAQCLALFSFVEASALMVDEKTTRLLIEDPNGLRNTIAAEYGERVEVRDAAMRELSKKIKGLTVLRSTEVLAMACELGFFSDYGVFERDAKLAALHALRRAGCSISHRELDEYENL